MRWFTIRLMARSSAWIAPTLVYLIWVAVTIDHRATALSNAPGLFYASVIWAIWMTISTGNLDSDEHRDLLAAASGSATRLHTQRASAVLIAAVPVGVAASALATAASVTDNMLRDFFICAMTTVGGALLGTSCGTWLHRPILRHRGMTVLISTLLVALIIVAPPTLWALDRAESAGTAFAVLTAALFGLWCAVSVTAASRLAARSR